MTKLLSRGDQRGLFLGLQRTFLRFDHARKQNRFLRRARPLLRHDDATRHRKQSAPLYNQPHVSN